MRIPDKSNASSSYTKAQRNLLPLQLEFHASFSRETAEFSRVLLFHTRIDTLGISIVGTPRDVRHKAFRNGTEKRVTTISWVRSSSSSYTSNQERVKQGWYMVRCVYTRENPLDSCHLPSGRQDSGDTLIHARRQGERRG